MARASQTRPQSRVNDADARQERALLEQQQLIREANENRDRLRALRLARDAANKAAPGKTSSLRRGKKG